MDVLDGLAEKLGRRDRRTLRRPGSAAVLVPIVDDGGEIRLIFTRRTDSVGTHKGQVAFPGGRVEPEDDGPIETALREAEEEVALPRRSVEVLGVLDEFPTVTDRVVVIPVVGRIVELPPLVPQPSEVARIFDIPLRALGEKDGWRSEMVEHRGEIWPLHFFDWDGEKLWGLTAFIVLHLLDLLPGGAPVEIPTHRIPK